MVRSPPTFALFFGLLLAVVAGMHWYLWARLARDTGLSDGWRRAAGVLLALGALSVPLSMMLLRRAAGRGSRIAVASVMTWLGTAFLLFVALVAVDLARLLALGGREAMGLLGRPGSPPDPGRRLFVARAVAGGALLVTGGAAVSSIRNATGEPTIHEVPVRLARLPSALSGFTLAQISDLHVGPTIRAKEVKRVVELTNALRPDAIVITGDLVDGSVPELRFATEHLAALKAKYGVFFVTGNHDYYSGARAWVEELSRYGIRALRNERVVLGDRGPGGASLDLAGVDDWSATRAENGRWPALDSALQGRDPDRSTVLLAHQPRGVSEAVRSGVELQLSGHTHGGQIFPWTLVVGAVYPYCKGLYRHEEPGHEGQVFVSCGTGYWGPPMRLGAPAEIAKVVLTT